MAGKPFLAVVTSACLLLALPSALAQGLQGRDGAPMALIPAGEFLRGHDNGDADERPARRVSLDAFLLDVHEVTNGRFARAGQPRARVRPGSARGREELSRAFVLPMPSDHIRRGPHRFMVTLEAYFDDSGEETEPRALSIAVAGAIAPLDLWREFEPDWLTVLDEYGVRHDQFHMTDLMNFKGEVFKAWEGSGACRRDRFVDRLMDVMVTHHLQPVGVNLPLYIYETLTSQRKELLYGKAYYACLHALFQILAQLVAPSGYPVNVILAEKKKHIGKAHKAFQIVRDVHPCGGRLVGFDPCRRPQDVIQLQAADLIAWEMTRFFKEPFRRTFDRLQEEMCGVLKILRLKDVATWFNEADNDAE